MPLFEVAIIERPTETERKDGKTEKLVFGPKAVVAKDSQPAAIHAALDGNRIEVNEDRMEVLVRPFV